MSESELLRWIRDNRQAILAGDEKVLDQLKKEVAALEARRKFREIESLHGAVTGVLESGAYFLEVAQHVRFAFSAWRRGRPPSS